MPEIFINGKPVQAEADQTVLQAALRERLLHPVLLLAQVAVDRRQLPHLRGPGGRQGLGRDRLQHAGRRRAARADRLRARARAPQGDAAVHHAQPSGRLRHLRQGRRVHAAGLSLRVQRRAVDLARRQGARSTKFVDAVASGSCSTTSAASCARAACASRARSRSRTRSASRSAATCRSCAPPRTARSTPIPIPTTSSTSARSARCCRGRSCTRRASGTSKPTPSVCPGCARGCTVDIWHRKPEWRLKALDPRQNTSIARVTPLENPAVNGPWICNKGRDLAQIFERPRARAADAQGQAGRARATPSTRRGADRRREASGRAGLELGLERGAGRVQEGARRRASPRSSRPTTCPRPASRRGRSADPRRQEPEHGRARARSSATARDPLRRRHRPRARLGRRLRLRRAAARREGDLPQRVPAPENGHADVFLPISIQTERAGHYTNFDGVVSAFEPCFAEAARGRRRRGAVRRSSRAPVEAAHDPGPRRLRRLHRLRARRADDASARS